MCDVVGTTVDDRSNGESLVVGAVRRAFARHGLSVDPERFRRYRGLAKRDAVARLVADAGAGASPRRIDAVHSAVAGEIAAAVDHMREMRGTREVFAFLKRRGIAVGVGSGLSVSALDRLVHRFAWRRDGLVDYVGSAEAVGVGRPHPALIREAMRRLGVTDPAAVLKVGDTAADVEEGKNAGVRTAAVLGTQSRERLARTGPDVILREVGEVVGLFGNREEN